MPVDHRVAELEAILGQHFDNPELLALALVHESSMEFTHGGARGPEQSNERLEFLGDAILGAAAAEFLYAEYPDQPEGTLTMLRAALVRRSTAALYADDIQLGRFLHVSRVAETSQGRGMMSVRSAAFEAVVGALFLDKGFDATAAFLLTFFRRHLPRILAEDLHRNAKSELQEYTQGLFHVTPRYVLVERSGPEHDSRFLVEVLVDGIGVARGSGVNRQQAEQAAARELLTQLRRAPASRLTS